MINQISEAINQKKLTEYKIIEKKYQILLRYLRKFTDINDGVMLRKDIEIILYSLEPSQEIEVKGE